MEDKHGNAIEPNAGVYITDDDSGQFFVGVVRLVGSAEFANIEVAVPVIGGVEIKNVYPRNCVVVVSARGTLVAWVRPGMPDEQPPASDVAHHPV